MPRPEGVFYTPIVDGLRSFPGRAGAEDGDDGSGGDGGRTWLRMRVVRIAVVLRWPPEHTWFLHHTFCSRLAMANAPVRTILELAGHQSITTTLRYMHLAKGAKHQAIELLDKRTNVASVEEAAEA